MLRSANRIMIKKRDLIMEILINQNIRRKNVNVSILVFHQVEEGTIKVVGTTTMRIPSDWIS